MVWLGTVLVMEDSGHWSHPPSHIFSLFFFFFFCGPRGSGVSHPTTLESSVDLFGPLVTIELLHTLLQGSVCCRYFAVPASESFCFLPIY